MFETGLGAAFEYQYTEISGDVEMNGLSLAQKNGGNGLNSVGRVPRLILAVDDDQDNLLMVSKTLQYEGFHVELASSGEEALEKLKVISPDLVLLDINMPGMSGLDTLKRLRLRDKYVSVIFVSARNETHDVVRGLDAGADDYVCKPFDPLELLARVRAQTTD